MDSYEITAVTPDVGKLPQMCAQDRPTVMKNDNAGVVDDAFTALNERETDLCVFASV